MPAATSRPAASMSLQFYFELHGSSKSYTVIYRKDIAKAINKVDQGQGVIILTDLFGGTPSNLAISLMKSENVEVIAGVNLPMLIRLEGARKVMPVHAAVAAAREAGRKYISVASEILGEAAA